MSSWKTGGALCLAVVLCGNCALGAEPTIADMYTNKAAAAAEREAPRPTGASLVSMPSESSTAKSQKSDSSSLVNNDNCTDWSDECCNLIPSCKMCPCTYGWAEGMLLWRDNDAGNRPLVINLNTQDTLISTGDLDFDAGWGIRAGFGCRQCDSGWEFAYLGVFDQDASRSVELADELAIPDDLGLFTNNFFFADEVSVRYESQINSAEINRVCCCCCSDGTCCRRSVEWLYGFRYLNLNEDFEIESTDLQEGTSTYDVHTNNNLFGVQVGNRVRHSCGRWSVEGTGKAGVFGNAADQHSDPIIDFPAFVVRPARSGSEESVAFVGDLNLTAIYQSNSVWGARLGYNLIWIEGVALAPDQLDFTNTATSGSGVDNDGGVFLHGLSAGVEARW
jgi:hypothetical protein